MNPSHEKPAVADKAFSDQDITQFIEQFLAVSGPDTKRFERINRFVQFYFAPQVVGLENLPNEPTMFVGNHAMFGLDGMIVMPMVYAKTGRFLRAMGDNAWFQSGAGQRMVASGMILGHPRVCSAMMEAGHDLLVFPGGAAEANKAESQKYSLIWRERYGFVRMAAQHGYSITPFGLVGPDDWWGHAVEGPELLHSRPVRLLQRLGVLGEIREDLVPPLPRGLFRTLLPRPEPSFLAFGEPISVPEYRDKPVPIRVQRKVRQQTEDSIRARIADMLLLRTQSRHQQGVLRRLLTG